MPGRTIPVRRLVVVTVDVQLTLKLPRSRQGAADNGAGIVGELGASDRISGKLGRGDGAVLKRRARNGGGAENDLVVRDTGVCDQSDRVLQ